MLRAMDGSTDSPCPAGRNLVDLVNSPHGCARGGLCHTDCTDITDFLLAALAGLTRAFLFACSLCSRNLVNLVDYFLAGIFSGCGVT